MKLHIVDGVGGPLARADAVAAHLSRLSFDIVHDTGTAGQADVFQPQTGSRVVNADFDLATRTPWRRLRISLSPAFRRWRHEIQTLERRQFADPSRVIAVSQMVRDQIASRYGLDPARITVIHNGVDNKRFTADRLATLRAPARLKWSLGDAATFLLVANNFDLKGVGTALHALARLRGFASNIRLAIAGGGDVERYSRVANPAGDRRSGRLPRQARSNRRGLCRRRCRFAADPLRRLQLGDAGGPSERSADHHDAQQWGSRTDHNGKAGHRAGSFQRRRSPSQSHGTFA